ncbi:MAG: hypothetical protein JW953_19510 [Anaerolineae bacterium]|nr:hypothetical protein [Anaerolineae bacterium]
MTQSSPSDYSPESLEQLQRLRVSVLAFQNEVAPLPANEQSQPHNEQFNQLRLEAQALLNKQGFDKRVPRAITEALAAEHSQKNIIPRISVIVVFGVILALFGLGINSIILEDIIINSLGCLISTLGMLLVVGAFVVLGTANMRQQRRLTNLGDLYQRCNMLLYEINHALNMDIPDLADRPAPDIPEISSAVELALDSLGKQALDWQQKLRTLEEQRLAAGPHAPLELTLNIDFMQRELNRVKQEMNRLRGRRLPAAEEVGTALPAPEEEAEI